MAHEFRRDEPGSVIFRDGLMYHWPEGGEWLPVLADWHVDEAGDVGITVREVDDPPASEPVPVVEVPVAERRTSPESPDDLLVEAVDEQPPGGRRPKAVSRTVRLPRTQVYRVGAVEYVDEVVATAVAHDEYVPEVPLPRQLVVQVPDGGPDEPGRVTPSRETVEPAGAAESTPGQVAPSDDVVTFDDPPAAEPARVTPTRQTVTAAEPEPSTPGAVEPSPETVAPVEPATSAPDRVKPVNYTVAPEPARPAAARRDLPATTEEVRPHGA